MPFEGDVKKTGKRTDSAKKGKKIRPSTVIPILVVVAGLGLLAYPTFSDWYNSFHQTKAITEYSEAVSNVNEEEYAALLESAYEYNEWLYETGHGLGLTDSELEEYEEQLSLSDTDVIGYIEIEKIDVYLPIYHGTSDAVLASGVGHLEGSSLPVGGESTHCILSGHRGLVSSRLFTDLDELEIGDTFVIYVLDQVLTYEVDQILVVEPEDTSALQIEEGQDYVTLFTCTPYGINSHRLLVRGHRIENAEDSAAVSEDTSVKMLIIICCIVIAIILAISFVLVWMKRKKKNSEKK